MMGTKVTAYTVNETYITENLVLYNTTINMNMTIYREQDTTHLIRMCGVQINKK